MSFKINKRINNISPSQTLAITSRAKDMKKKGIDVISFGAGEPDFDTPDFVKEAAIKAIKDGFTKYTDVGGIIELKEAICKKLKQDNNLDYIPDEIAVSCGAKHSLFNVLLAICEEGDNIIVPAPYWVSYPEMIKLAGGAPVILESDKKRDFKISVSELDSLLKKNKKIKGLILNSPSNPTGMMYSKKELEDIADWAMKNNIFIISDEIYEKIVYEKSHISIASLSEIKKQTIVVNGLSKSHSMTGWRLGYMAGDMGVAKAVSKLQSHSTSNANSIAQKAALTALEGKQDIVEHMRKEFKKRRDLIVKGLNNISGINCLTPDGAFYVFPEISGLFNDKCKNSLELSSLLLNEIKIATVPGIAFGNDNYIRLSYATSEELIIKGLERLKNFCEK
jgi:aspartate aminotransferase